MEILDSLDTLPGMVVNARYDVIARNRAHANLIHDWHTVPCEARNVLWCCFCDPEVRTRFVNFDDEAPHLVATLRASSAQHLDEPGWTEFISRLSGRSAAFAELWKRHEVASPGPRLKPFRHPVVGDLLFTATSLAVSGVPEHRILVYTPYDSQTRGKLPLPDAGQGLIGRPGERPDLGPARS
ncbi:MAG TPA: hypothetical protein VGJ07_16140 [Rugosimonospora sp.]